MERSNGLRESVIALHSEWWKDSGTVPAGIQSSPDLNHRGSCLASLCLSWSERPQNAIAHIAPPACSQEERVPQVVLGLSPPLAQSRSLPS